MRMKRLFFLILLFFSINSYCQNADVINAFKYAWVPVDDNKIVEPWKTLRDLIRYKNIKLLKTENGHPVEIFDGAMNPCLTAGWNVKFVNVGERRGMKLYDLFIVVIDCRTEVVFQTKSVRVKKDTEEGFRSATIKAFEQLARFKHAFNESLNNTLYLPEVEKTNETENSIRTYLDNSKIDEIEGIYKSTDGPNQYRIGIRRKGNQYVGVILDTNVSYWKPGEIKAYLESTSIASVYSIKFYNVIKRRTECFAEFDQLILSIRIKDLGSDDNKLIAQFIKIYPVK